MIFESKISSKNQVTLPKKIMRRLGLSPRDRIVFQEEDGAVIIRPKNKTLSQLRGSFPRQGQKALSPEQMEEAIGGGGNDS